MSVFKIVLLPVLALSLAGCSTVSNWFHGDDNYRGYEAELAKELEMPPNFIVRQTDNARMMERSMAQVDRNNISDIPAYSVEGVRVESNLVERWLEFDDKAPMQVWNSMREFLTSQGFRIEEERLDIGLIETGYVARRDIAPVEQEVGMLTRLLNSWRPETATGVYDRFTLLVDTKSSQDQVRVYVRHHMMLADSSDTITNWSVRPYDPAMEALTLYRAMLFFGATQNDAFEEIRTASFYQEVIRGEELSGLVLDAGLSQSWDYLQAMIYRADWQVKSQDPSAHSMWVTVPNLTASGGFFSRLFARNQPIDVQLSLSRHEDSNELTLLSLETESGQTPLNAERRKQVFKALGLLEY